MSANGTVEVPRTILISRDGLTHSAPPENDDHPFHEVVAGAQVRSRVLVASTGALRRVDLWTSPTGVVLHAFAEDPERPTEATLALGAMSVLALADLVGIGRGSEVALAANSERRTFADADRFLAAVVAAEIDAQPGADIRGFVIGTRASDSDSVSSVTILHAGSTSWCGHDAAAPVELEARNFVELWSALAPVVAPIT